MCLTKLIIINISNLKRSMSNVYINMLAILEYTSKKRENKKKMEKKVNRQTDNINQHLS